MNKFLRSTVSKLHDTVSAPVSYTRGALVERLQSNTTYLLYQKTKKKLGYGQTMTYTVPNKAEKEDDNEQQQDDDEQYDTVPKRRLVYKGIRIKKFRVTKNLNSINTRMANLTQRTKMRTKCDLFVKIRVPLRCWRD